MRNDKENGYKDEEEGGSNESESIIENTEQSSPAYLYTITETDREYIEESYLTGGIGKDSARLFETSLVQRKISQGEGVLAEVSSMSDLNLGQAGSNLALDKLDISSSPKLKKLNIPIIPKLPINSDTQTVASTATKTNRDCVQTLKILTYPEENYDGEVDENYVRNGYGVYEYDNGDIYEGEFADGLRNGEGEYTYFDGSLYRGYWLHDKKHGKGTFKFDKYEFDGEWENDCLLQGFTFKINHFDKNTSSILDEESNEDDYDFDNCNNVNYSNSCISNIEHNSSFNSEIHDKLVEVDKIDEENLREFIIKNKKRFSNYNVDIELVGVKNKGNKHNLINHIIENKISEFEWTDESTPTSISGNHLQHFVGLDSKHDIKIDNKLDNKPDLKFNPNFPLGNSN